MARTAVGQTQESVFQRSVSVAEFLVGSGIIGAVVAILVYIGNIKEQGAVNAAQLNTPPQMATAVDQAQDVRINRNSDFSLDTRRSLEEFKRDVASENKELWQHMTRNETMTEMLVKDRGLTPPAPVIPRGIRK